MAEELNLGDYFAELKGGAESLIAQPATQKFYFILPATLYKEWCSGQGDVYEALKEMSERYNAEFVKPYRSFGLGGFVNQDNSDPAWQ